MQSYEVDCLPDGDNGGLLTVVSETSEGKLLRTPVSDDNLADLLKTIKANGGRVFYIATAFEGHVDD